VVCVGECVCVMWCLFVLLRYVVVGIFGFRFVCFCVVLY